MIDTPQNCFVRAAASREEAEGPMLESVRNKHLASAAAWEGLAEILRDRANNLPERPVSARSRLIPATA